MEARPPTPLYRFRKWIRRHKTAAIASAAILSILLLALGVSTAGYLRLRYFVSETNDAYQNRSLAESAQRHMEERAREMEERARIIAEDQRAMER
ncbi:MAG: hypothetical protein V4710_06210, partial [Verrucomicrobiota bacterium]